MGKDHNKPGYFMDWYYNKGGAEKMKAWKKKQNDPSTIKKHTKFI